MENTDKVFFDDPAPQWFIAFGQSWIGPLSAEDVYRKLKAQEISWVHYVWRQGQSGWQRVCDVPTFQAVAPNEPSKEMIGELKKTSGSKKPPKPPAKDEEEEAPREWYLYYNESQFGPFSPSEIHRFLQSGKIHARVHAWRDGMENWMRIESIAEFGDAKKSKAAPPKSSSKEQRSTPRKPLVAKLFLSNQEDVITAVCRDISVGGMQVLTDQIPGKPGSRLKMNVTPPGGSKAGRMDPFVAEGVIVRILEDGRGFSFRFEKLSDAARKSIEQYVISIE